MKFFYTLLIALLITNGAFAQNNSLTFDGNDDHVEIPSAAAFTPNQFTIEVWIKADQGNLYQPVFTKYDSGALMASYSVTIYADNKIGLSVIQNIDPNIYRSEITNSAVLTPGVWQHVATSFDFVSQDIKIYIDGAEVPSSLGSGSVILTSINNNTTPVRLGRLINFSGSSSYFKGKMDDVRFWNTERTATEISNNINTELTGMESGLVAYYKMDDDNSSCDIESCQSAERHGARKGESGNNNLPQFSNDVPALTNIDCGVTIACVPLPVELIEFSGKLTDDQVVLHWATATELNNKGFDIEYSPDGQEWKSIGFVKGTGTIDLTQSYKFIHRAPTSATNYYRLRQVDFDNTYSYSRVIIINNENTSIENSIFPNPLKGKKLHIRLVNNNTLTNVQIVDVFGQLVFSDQLPPVDNNSYHTLELPHLPTGIYWVQIGDQNSRKTIRLYITNE
ncbi:MAG: LamG-like jellyroll fold domain-containing protein [Saprospiraceae bacterium]